MDIVIESIWAACSLSNLLPALFGVIVGIAIGALPGFSVTMGVALPCPALNPISKRSHLEVEIFIYSF